MLPDRMSGAARAVMDAAVGEARRLGHGHVGAEHLLLAMLDDPATVAGGMLAEAGLTHDAVSAMIAETIHTDVGSDRAPAAQPEPNAEYRTVTERGLREALQYGLGYVTTDCLLLAMLNDRRNLGARILATVGLDADNCRKQLGYPARAIAPNPEMSDDLAAVTKENTALRAALAEMRPVFDQAVRDGLRRGSDQKWAHRVAARIGAGEFGEPRHLS